MQNSKKISDVYRGQSFHIWRYMKFEKFDRKSPSFVGIKVFVFDYKQNSKSWMLKKLEKKSLKSPRYPTYQSFRSGHFFVFLQLNYGIEVYANTEATFLKSIKISQNRIPRILQFRHQRSPTNDLYTTFKILKLEDMQQMKLLSVIFKLVHIPDEFPEVLKALFTQHCQVHRYNTRK